MKWLQASHDAAYYKAFRKEFSTRDLFRASHPLSSNLYNRYDSSSKLIHSCIYGFSRNVESSTKPGMWQLTFSYCDVKDEDVSEPVGKLLYTHTSILANLDSSDSGPIVQMG
jgi:hypothetical protein